MAHPLRSSTLAGCLVLLGPAASVRVAVAQTSEFTAVPLLGGNSDVGFGGGYMLSYARVRKGYQPYHWRLESGGGITFKAPDAGEPGGVQMPYLDDYLLLDFPHAERDRFEVQLRLSFTREATLKFYGLGNASEIEPGQDASGSYFEHERVHPTLRWLSTLHVTPSVDLSWGLGYTHNWLVVPEQTLLGQTMAQGSPEEQRLLGSATPHGTFAVSAGTAFDTRNHAVTTERGQYHTARIDWNPGGAAGLPYEWARLTAAARVYVPVIRKRLIFGARVATDLLIGDAPFYELPRYDDTFFGGSSGVRGVPAQRYWGKAKLFSNFELRGNLTSLDFWGKTNWLGVTGFFDCGRLWADYSVQPELDGTGLGLKLGAGAGLRVTAGTSFVVRADIAYSPDASPLGAYLTSGQMF